MSVRHVFVLLALAVAVSHSQLGKDELEQVTTKIYCGNSLSQTLSTVCRGNYNTLTKKSETTDQKASWTARYGSDSERDVEFPFQSKSSATSLMSPYRRRRKRGVFNECCEKACSQEELSSYCGTRKRRK